MVQASDVDPTCSECGGPVEPIGAILNQCYVRDGQFFCWGCVARLDPPALREALDAENYAARRLRSSELKE